MRYCVTDEVLARMVGQSMVLFHPETERLVTLNACGSRIWQLLTEGASWQEITVRLEEEFDGPRDQIEREAGDFLSELAAEQLVRAVSEAPACPNAGV